MTRCKEHSHFKVNFQTPQIRTPQNATYIRNEMETLYTETWPQDYKTFFMINSAEIKIYPTHKCWMPTIVGILTFISRINDWLLSPKSEISIDFGYFRIYKQLKFQLSWEWKKVYNLRASTVCYGFSVWKWPCILSVFVTTSLTEISIACITRKREREYTSSTF